MSKELEKAFLKKYPNTVMDIMHSHSSYSIFKAGFQAAIESEQVQGLVKALEFYKAEDFDINIDNGTAAIALEKFRGGE